MSAIPPHPKSLGPVAVDHHVGTVRRPAISAPWWLAPIWLICMWVACSTDDTDGDGSGDDVDSAFDAADGSADLQSSDLSGDSGPGDTNRDEGDVVADQSDQSRDPVNSDLSTTTDVVADPASDLPTLDVTDEGGPDTTLPDLGLPDLGADTGPPPTCAQPEFALSVDAAAALELQNQLRAEMGIPCAIMHATINTAAELHCDYYAANQDEPACIANAHAEVSGCDLFVGEQFWTRMSAAGYTGSPAFEDMHFIEDGAGAVQGWVDSVWHRTPILSPWVRDVGYGNAVGCDTMDFGRGETTSDTVIATFPYAGQTDVPTSFNGREGPEPPRPPDGWPSGYPIHIYARSVSITSHVLTELGSSDPIDHIWITPGTSDLLSNEVVLYSYEPLESDTTYRVRVEGTYVGGALDLDFGFTTR